MKRYHVHLSPDKSAIRLLEGAEKEKYLGYLEYLSKIITDEKEINHLWGGWCAMKGPECLKALNVSEHMLDKANENNYMSVLNARDLFTCEAHNELTATFLRMVCEDRVETGIEQIPRIKRLQKGIID